jgi:hypothetical protein
MAPRADKGATSAPSTPAPGRPRGAPRAPAAHPRLRYRVLVTPTKPDDAAAEAVLDWLAELLRR